MAALAAGSDVDTLEQQIRRYHPVAAALFDEKAAADLRVRVADTNTTVLSGMDGLCTLAAMELLPPVEGQTDMLLNAVVGMVGLQPTLAAIRAGHDVALANKETLVAVALALAGIALLFMGFLCTPAGEIHNSVLVGFGEISTFSGALFGVDYTYKYRYRKQDEKE